MSTTLVLGGVRSGKSRHAEHLLAGPDPVTYVATGAPVDRPDPAGDPDGDREWADRVAQHRARRPEHWTTVETLDLSAVLVRERGRVLVDCLGEWLTRRADEIGWDDPLLADRLEEAFGELLEAWTGTAAEVVLVSNEVGWGVVPASASGRLFRDLMGRWNASLAASADRVHVIVAGRVLDLSTAPVVGE